MGREFIIGRSPSSPIEVPPDRVGVSGQHVRITISDSGQWELEDLNSTNGTYIRDDDGYFHRVYRKTISENTVIRMGKEGHTSYAFTAHHLLEDKDDYKYEFLKLRQEEKAIAGMEERAKRRNARNMNIIKLAAPGAMVLCVVAQYTVPGLKDDTDLNLWISRGAMMVAPAVAGVIWKVDNSWQNKYRQLRKRVMRCPRCGYPLSDFEVENMQCSKCKAK